jgi:hypothetical protein
MEQSDESFEISEAVAQLCKQLCILVKDSSELLAPLHVPNTMRKHFTLPYDHSTAKRFFLSGCLMEVQTMVGSQIRLLEFMQAQAAKPLVGSGIQAVVTSSIVAEMNLWRRRLAEVLTSLILFSTTDTADHYYHYLLLHDAEDNSRNMESMKRDFGVVSETFKRRGEVLRKNLDALRLPSVLWYAKSGKGVQTASAATMIRSAVALAAPYEQGALGYSYLHSFSAPSGKIHFSATPDRTKSDSTEIRSASSALFLLATAITARVGSLSGFPSICRVDLLPAKRSQNHPEVGDFVVLVLDEDSLFVAETVSIASKTELITAIRVRFIGESPYPDVLEDVFTSDYLHTFMRRTEILYSVLERAGDLEISHSDIDEAVRATVLEIWKVTARDWYHQRLREASARTEEMDQTWLGMLVPTSTNKVHC